MKRYQALAILSLITLSSCSDALTPMQTTHQSIIDGTADDTDAVVFVLSNVSADSSVYCSGVLVAPHLVLTSRDCVSETETNYVVCGRTEYLGTYNARKISVSNVSAISNSTDFVGASRVFVPEGTDVCGNDIALIVLEEEIDATPIPPSLEPDVAAGDVYRAFGYGAPESTGLGSGIRRVGDGEVLCVGTDCPSQVVFGEFYGADGFCGGDGGGPAVADGKVIGLSSRKSGPCEESTLTMVGAHAEFLMAAAREASADGGFDVPAWAGADEPDSGTNGTNNSTGGTNNTTATNNTSGTNNDAETTGGSSTNNATSEDEGGCSSVDGSPNIFALALLLGGLLFQRRR